MRRLGIAVSTVALTFAAMGIAASADAPPPTTFVAVLNADEEVPQCAAATNASRGLAPRGVARGVVQPLAPTPGEENGVIKKRTFTNPAVVAGLQADASRYYVNVHSTVCPSGVIRGQLGDHGP